MVSPYKLQAYQTRANLDMATLITTRDPRFESPVGNNQMHHRHMLINKFIDRTGLSIIGRLAYAKYQSNTTPTMHGNA